jgi:hypothetical protein
LVCQDPFVLFNAGNLGDAALTDAATAYAARLVGLATALKKRNMAA